MELIPILSTIILVATISTFILAVGAYILYKIRERKYQESKASRYEMQQAELVEPAELQQEKIYVDDIINQVKRVPKKEVRYQPVIQGKSTLSPQYSSRKQRENLEKTRKEQKPEIPDSRYLKYTDEGYISLKEDRDNGEIKWR